MKRPKIEDTKTPTGHQSTGGNSVNIYAYSKMQDKYIDYIEQQLEKSPTIAVIEQRNDNVNTLALIKFGAYLTGHDESTIEQMLNDYNLRPR